MARCPVPDCSEPVPDARYALFCATHHCALPVGQRRFLLRFQMQCTRRGEIEHMQAQLPGYIAPAVRAIQSRVAH